MPVSEIQRFLRHALTPAVAFLVAQGYLPESVQGPALEFGITGATFALVYLWSYAKERKAKSE